MQCRGSREGRHDDLVLAIMIAAWQGEHLKELWAA
jgi:hypothetical protein